jgi:hypothetical protein
MMVLTSGAAAWKRTSVSPYGDERAKRKKQHNKTKQNKINKRNSKNNKQHHKQQESVDEETLEEHMKAAKGPYIWICEPLPHVRLVEIFREDLLPIVAQDVRTEELERSRGRYLDNENGSFTRAGDIPLADFMAINQHCGTSGIRIESQICVEDK